MNNLALAYRAAGKLDQALPLLEETLKLRKAKLGPEHPDTLGTMNNLAWAFRHLTSLSEAAAQALGKHKGELILRGLTSLSDAAAQALGKHKGKLHLEGLTSLSDAAAQALAQHEGSLYLSYEAGKAVERARKRLAKQK